MGRSNKKRKKRLFHGLFIGLILFLLGGVFFIASYRKTSSLPRENLEQHTHIHPQREKPEEHTDRQKTAIIGNDRDNVDDTILSPEVLPAQAPVNPFGITFGATSWTDSIDHNPAGFLEELNTGCVRINIYWNMLEPAKGRYSFDRLDLFVNNMQKVDCDVLINFRSASKWATAISSAQHPLSMPKNMNEYRNILKMMVERYKDKVKYYQIGNETDIRTYWRGTDEEYIELMRESYKTIKGIAPDSRILLSGFTGGQKKGTRDPINLHLNESLLKGLKGYFDVLDIHLYMSIHTFEERIAWYRNTMKKYGYDNPIWTTECGGPDPRLCGHFQGYIDKVKAAMDAGGMVANGKKAYALFESMIVPKIKQEGCAYVKPFFNPRQDSKKLLDLLQCRQVLKRNLMAMAAGAERVFWFNLFSPETHPIFGKMGLLTKDFHKKPAFHAYILMTEKLQGIRYVKKKIQNNILIFEIVNNNDAKMYVLWKKADPHKISTDSVAVKLPVAFTKAVQTDVLGNTKSLDVLQGQLTVNVNETPVYIEGK